jgi:hypothetical protein
MMEPAYFLYRHLRSGQSRFKTIFFVI